MTKTTATNLALSAMLTAAFPALWVYNQRINYQPIFTRQTKFSLRCNHLAPTQLSSVSAIRAYLAGKSGSAVLMPKVVTSAEFGVLGRIITTEYGNWEIYEYESPQSAGKRLISLGSSYPQVFQYKNLLINDLTNAAIVRPDYEHL